MTVEHKEMAAKKRRRALARKISENNKKKAIIRLEKKKEHQKLEAERLEKMSSKLIDEKIDEAHDELIKVAVIAHPEYEKYIKADKRVDNVLDEDVFDRDGVVDTTGIAGTLRLHTKHIATLAVFGGIGFVDFAMAQSFFNLVASSGQDTPGILNFLLKLSAPAIFILIEVIFGLKKEKLTGLTAQVAEHWATYDGSDCYNRSRSCGASLDGRTSIRS